MAKNRTILLAIFVVIIIFVSGVFLFKDQIKDKTTSWFKKGNSENQDGIMSDDEGDFIYKPSDEAISYDSEEQVLFYENLLNVFLVSEITDKQAEELVSVVNGTIVGKIQAPVNMLQIQVEGDSLNELYQLAEQLENDPLVKYADSSTPSFISDANMNHLFMDKEELAEANLEENWWAEAIDAYSAWYYMDKYKEKFSDVKVAVLENGKLGRKDNEIDDESIASVKVTDHSSEKGKYYTIDKLNISHAELVTKVIAAKKNPQTIRGVAEPFAKVEFTSIGGLSNDDIIDKVEEVVIGSMSEAEIIDQINNTIKENSVDKDAKVVVNNSWADPPKSYNNWKKDNFWSNLFKGYESKKEAHKAYVDTKKESNDKVSSQLIIALDNILQSRKNNFLIVQGAGNGYSLAKGEKMSEDTSIEVEASGFFANINEGTYKEVEDSVETKLDEILNHIIIVGGAEKVEGTDAYHSPVWASYGEAIDIAAPASNLFKDEESSKDQESKGIVRGTSYATPMVSGAAALIWSYDQTLTAKEVKNLLLNNAVHYVEDHKDGKIYTYPLLNMTSFLNEAPYNISIVEALMDEFPYYNDLIETYRAAINEQWDNEKIIAENLGPAYEQPDHVIFDNYGYELRDLNGNSLPELILGVHREDGSADIHEIYTLQNQKPVKLFTKGIRTNVEIYKDGTISETYGDRAIGYFKLNRDGIPELENGYDLKSDGNYRSLVEPDQLVTSVDQKEMHEEYKKIGLSNHLFIPFVLNDEEAQGIDQDVSNGLSDVELKKVMEENYQKIEDVLLSYSINDLYDKHHTIDEAQSIWESGIDPNSPFYKELYEMFYPLVSELVAEEGMESFIHEKYSLFWHPVTPISFFGPAPSLEVLEKDHYRFRIKQTKEIRPQEIGGDSELLIYIVDYVKEDRKWKFAGVRKLR